MELLSKELKVDMNVKKQLQGLQRRDELCPEQRLKTKTVVQKWVAGLQTLSAQHGAIFDELEAEFMTGNFDSIIYNTISPSTGAHCWSFVKVFLASRAASAAKQASQELETIAETKAAEASALEDRALSEKKDGFHWK